MRPSRKLSNRPRGPKPAGRSTDNRPDTAENDVSASKATPVKDRELLSPAFTQVPKGRWTKANNQGSKDTQAEYEPLETQYEKILRARAIKLEIRRKEEEELMRRRTKAWPTDEALERSWRGVKPRLEVQYQHDFPKPNYPKPRTGIAVGQPRETYLKLAEPEPERLEVPSPKLVILDLNGTLLFRNANRSVAGSVARASKQPVLRPSLAPFLEYLFLHFKVMVWSSAMPFSVNAMVKAAFSQDQQDNLVAVWARDTFGLSPHEYRQKTVTYKDLDIVWKHRVIDASYPSEDGYWGPHNTILLDDSALKASMQPYNHIQLPEFDRLAASGSDAVLDQVAGYLDELRYQRNICSYVKRKPFEVTQSRSPTMPFLTRHLAEAGEDRPWA
ncbi:hypothetical protein YB2330_002720 [Saitoella coloradoensis]